MKPKSPWLRPVLGFGLFLSACTGEILDDFGTAGFAQLQGSALQADGSRFATIFVICGPDAPNEFGGLFHTDSIGGFDVTLVRPGAHLPPADLLVCAARAPGDALSVVSDTLTVPFTVDRAARITTVVTLHAP